MNTPFTAQIKTAFIKFFELLTQPSAAVTSLSDRRRARLVAALLLPLCLLMVVGSFLAPLPAVRMVLAAGVFSGLAGYALGRTRYFFLGGLLGVTTLFVTVFFTLQTQISTPAMGVMGRSSWLAVPLLLAASFLRPAWFAAIWAVTLTSLALASFAFRPYQFFDFIPAMLQLGVFGLLVFLACWLRYRDLEDLDESTRALLEARELNFSELVATSQFLFFRADAGGRYTQLNAAWEKSLGYTVQEMLGRKLTEFKKPEDVAASMEIHRQVMAGQTLMNHETTYLSKSGGEVALLVEIKPLRDEAGRIIGAQGTALDATASRQAGEHLRAQQRLLDSIFMTAPILLWVKDRAGKYVMVTQEFSRTYGGETSDFIGKNLYELGYVTEETQKRWEEEDRKVFEEGISIDNPGIELQLQTGEKRWQTLKKVPLRVENGEIAYLVGAGINITQQKETEEKLRDSEELFRSLVEHSPSLIAMKDLEGRYLLVNRLFEEWFGISKENVIGRTPAEIFPEAYATLEAQRDREMAASGKVLHHEMDMTHTDGSVRKTITTKFPVRDPSGQITGVGTFASDVSDRKDLEEQLRQTQKMQALGTLAGGIAHDFNNILFPILGFADLAMESLDPESPQYDFLSLISSSAERAQDLVSRILLFSRFSSTEKSPQQLAPVVHEVVQFLRSAVSATVEIRPHISEDAPPVICDSTQIHQVLMNLCINAGKAMPDGGVLEVSLEAVELEGLTCFDGTSLRGRHVRIGVKDIGLGIEPEHLPKIFDPFFTTREAGQGTGLGLSTVFGIVKEHAGGIVVQSQIGQGTEFQVYLPAAKAAQETLQTPKIPVAEGGTETILYVDDELSITGLGKRALEKLGYRVQAVNDSREALSLFLASPGMFDLVVTDQTMPGMTGRQLAEEIRKTRPEIPILLCSGHTQDLEEENQNLSVDLVVSKPIRIRELGRLVRQMLDNRPPGASSGEPGVPR